MNNIDQQFFSDINVVLNQCHFDFVVINLAVDEPTTIAKRLGDNFPPSTCEVLTEKGCVTLTELIKKTQSDLSSMGSVLLLICTNNLQFSQIEHVSINGHDLNSLLPEIVVQTSNVQMYNGENYFGEETL